MEGEGKKKTTAEMSEDIFLDNISAPLNATAKLKNCHLQLQKLWLTQNTMYNNKIFLFIHLCFSWIHSREISGIPDQLRLVVNIGIIYETFIIKLLYSVRNWELGHIQMIWGLRSQNKPLIKKKLLWIFCHCLRHEKLDNFVPKKSSGSSRKELVGNGSCGAM